MALCPSSTVFYGYTMFKTRVLLKNRVMDSGSRAGMARSGVYTRRETRITAIYRSTTPIRHPRTHTREPRDTKAIHHSHNLLHVELVIAINPRQGLQRKMYKQVRLSYRAETYFDIGRERIRVAKC